MNIMAGLRFIVFLLIFGWVNYLMMIRRYEIDLRKRSTIQKSKISRLYPKGTFISI